ncbi:MAG: DegT/DnrJ/EryC1/StrS aminotransferase family protein [Acetobacteraceae bacterium]|nr:DegT/DnrJ/EryC1/StrS aminotransferase family protein [Acetobacteraceae bacterium]
MLLVSEPSLGEQEKAALVEVIESNWITMGDRVRAFENLFAAEHGLHDAVAVNSCTAGLHLALAGLGIGPGDEVLIPSLSFVATANCVLYVGATPVFVDINGFDSPVISIDDAARKFTTRTKAVILMHYAGYLVDAGAWREFAETRGLLLIEDAAHAAGTIGAGLFGDAAAFSFYGNKNMTTAEGGMVTARDSQVLERIRSMRGHAMTSGTKERLHARTPTYDVTMLGWNYRLDELRAALGIAQLRNLQRWNEQRAKLTGTYRRALAESCCGVQVPFSSENFASAYHILPALLPEGVDRADVMRKMYDAGIQTTFHYPPIHTLSFYQSLTPRAHLPKTEQFALRELTLPLHPKMEEADVRQVVSTLAAIVKCH